MASSDDVMSTVKDVLEKQDVTLLLIGAVIAVFGLVVLFMFFGRRSRGNVVLIVGPASSGKTCLFFQLKDRSIHNGTVASMTENEGLCTVLTDKDKPCGQVRLVDIPGHPRLRHKLEQHLKDAIAIVFVLDASDITPSKTEAAEELYDVLINPVVYKPKTPILIACNKTDLEAAYSVEFIKRTVEKQLDTLRKTKSSLTGDAPTTSGALLGKLDKPFSLSTLRSPVSVAPISALKGSVTPVQQFLFECISR